MINLNKTLFVWLLLGLSLLIWVILARVCSIHATQFLDLIGLFPTVVTIDCAAIAVFVKWLWKWPLLYPWLVPFANLNGVWKGEIRSTYKAESTEQSIEPISATLRVRQTFMSISCVMTTTDMSSSSSHAALYVNREMQVEQLVYIYCSRPNMALGDRSAMHDGAVVLDILGNPPNKLAGRYWTTRGTAGDIELKRSR